MQLVNTKTPPIYWISSHLLYKPIISIGLVCILLSLGYFFFLLPLFPLLSVFNGIALGLLTIGILILLIIIVERRHGKEREKNKYLWLLSLVLFVVSLILLCLAFLVHAIFIAPLLIAIISVISGISVVIFFALPLYDRSKETNYLLVKYVLSFIMGSIGLGLLTISSFASFLSAIGFMVVGATTMVFLFSSFDHLRKKQWDILKWLAIILIVLGTINLVLFGLGNSHTFFSVTLASLCLEIGAFLLALPSHFSPSKLTRVIYPTNGITQEESSTYSKSPVDVAHENQAKFSPSLSSTKPTSPTCNIKVYPTTNLGTKAKQTLKVSVSSQDSDNSLKTQVATYNNFYATKKKM